MGCCHSDMTGEKQPDVTAEAPQPLKKVQTNFSTVDYDSGASTRRDTVYAPNEVARKKTSNELPSVVESTAPDDPAPTQDRNPSTIGPTTARAAEPKLLDQSQENPISTHNLESEPYRDIDDTNANSPTVHTKGNTTIPAVGAGTTFSPDIPSTTYDLTTNPSDMGLFSKKQTSLEQPAPRLSNGTSFGNTSTPDRKGIHLNVFPVEDSVVTPGGRLFGFEHMTPEEKKLFSSLPLSNRQSTDSASAYSASIDKDRENGIETATGESKEKKSLYRKYQDLKRGPGTSGLSDEDLMKYTGKTRAELDQMAKTTPGVAGNQYAGSITAGGTSGFGLTGTGEGLGGWGREGSKDPVIR